MRMSGIGGQAVLEGIMMKNGDEYSLAVRLPDGEIHVEKDTYNSIAKKTGLGKVPFVRGVVIFIDSLILGISTLMKSSLYFADEGDEKAEDGTAEKPSERISKSDKIFMGITLAVSLVIALVFFVFLPLLVTNFFKRFIESSVILAVIEGAVKVAIFLGYLIFISRMKDIRRTFMYHGAEHKCINCVEHEKELTVDNVRESSRFHKRCGTSFLFYVVIISVIIGFFIQSGSMAVRLGVRLALIPVIAGISYEFIRLAGRSENPLVSAFAKPGLAMQKVTTAEPDDSMIEVAIKAVEEVFDWRAFLAEGAGHTAREGRTSEEAS